MVGQAVEQRARYPRVGEHLGLLPEGQVGGDEQRRVLVEMGDEVEQGLPSGACEGQVVQFVDDDEVAPPRRMASARRPWRPSRCSCSRRLTSSTALKKRPRTPRRMGAGDRHG